MLLLYADDESFTLMTRQGHAFSGWITCSAFEDGGATVAQAQVPMRAADPICEIGLILGGHRKEDAFWTHTLAQVARRLGVYEPAVEQRTVCVGPHRQRPRAGNIWQNGAVRTSFHRSSAPLRSMARLPARAFGRRPG